MQACKCFSSLSRTRDMPGTFQRTPEADPSPHFAFHASGSHAHIGAMELQGGIYDGSLLASGDAIGSPNENAFWDACSQRCHCTLIWVLVRMPSADLVDIRASGERHARVAYLKLPSS